MGQGGGKPGKPGKPGNGQPSKPGSPRPRGPGRALSVWTTLPPSAPADRDWPRPAASRGYPSDQAPATMGTDGMREYPPPCQLSDILSFEKRAIMALNIYRKTGCRFSDKLFQSYSQIKIAELTQVKVCPRPVAENVSS